MSPRQFARRNRSPRVDVRPHVREALFQLLEPLARFALDSGLSIQEVNSVFRESAVRTVAAEQRQAARRVSISGIAASTGITRAEVSRILKSHLNVTNKVADRHEQLTTRVLRAWREDPKFMSPKGQPSDLRIYGRGPTFEALVKIHGGGIPTRAMLDELSRKSAIDIRPFQVVRLKSAAVDQRMTPKVINEFGDRAAELISTMLHNSMYPSGTAFFANVSANMISSSAIHLFRKELSTKGTDFLADIEKMLRRGPKELLAARGSSPSDLKVTIFYHQASATIKPKPQLLTARRNLRRVR
jgi:hypothetical protein